ncbi:hypothetical protein FJM67_16800 [Maribrevibacterium harenarium]|uniref:DNA replication terminus site-binding protein n=1 Tax=Maribrevibacterium harenarium TaxID=2589817 RepID=A0A501W7C5_9GAMM|nr:hypothetical protein [Maribrevibacterium harenarium]TPE44602.1 hypothetical protein FJM67_16800 [Maribrevibacterium harenarium]
MYFMEALLHLKDATKKLHQHAGKVHQAILEDSLFSVILPIEKDDSPIDLEEYRSDHHRKAVADSITLLVYQSDNDLLDTDINIKCGVVTLTDQSIALINQFNAVKNDFKNATVQLRRLIKANNARKLSDALEFFQENQLRSLRKDIEAEKIVPVIESEWRLINRLFKSMNFEAIDLNRAYTNIHTFSQQIGAVSLSWARNHNSFKRLKDVEAQREFAEQHLQSKALNVALDLIEKNDGAPLAIVQTKPPKMIANLTFFQPTSEGKVRQVIKVSGIIAVVPPMPKVIYRRIDEMRTSSKPRCDSKLESSPYIVSLSAYRYKAKVDHKE